MRPLAVLGNVDLFVSPNSKLTGNFLNDEVPFLNLSGTMDTVVYQQRSFTGNDFNFMASKPRDSTRGKSTLTLRSANQRFSKVFKTKNIFVDAQWEKDHIDFALDADQDGNTNILRMKSELDFLEDSLKIKILPTQLRIFDEYWRLRADKYKPGVEY